MGRGQRVDGLHFVLRLHGQGSHGILRCRSQRLRGLRRAHHAAVSVRHVFAQANIAHEDEVRHFALEGSGGLLNDSVFRPGAGGNLVLGLRQSEEDDGGNAQRRGGSRFFHRFIHGKIEHARHRPDFLAHTLARADEQRVHKGLRGEPGLADQGAQALILAQAAEACDREGHGVILAGRKAGSRQSSVFGRQPSAAGVALID